MFQLTGENNEVALDNRLGRSGPAGCRATKNPQKQAQ